MRTSSEGMSLAGTWARTLDSLKNKKNVVEAIPISSLSVIRCCLSMIRMMVPMVWEIKTASFDGGDLKQAEAQA
ncbi:unnamed protein product [Coffea canephora]|uniref:Uncharacterized protein n=1 Tax=Coffea canephora TaxID=49390 RepID=A0A068U0S3_COFCA|nr:unnamed protein product [Coffea canephora]